MNLTLAFECGTKLLEQHVDRDYEPANKIHVTCDVRVFCATLGRAVWHFCTNSIAAVDSQNCPSPDFCHGLLSGTHTTTV